MGSAIQASTMPEDKRKMFINVFSKLKQQVLWKWETETMPDLPKNVKLSKWLPQQDLLGHKDIKMFITHCGGGSTEEAIYHGLVIDLYYLNVITFLKKYKMQSYFLNNLFQSEHLCWAFQ